MGYGIELELRDAIVAIRSGNKSLAARQLSRALGLVVYTVAAPASLYVFVCVYIYIYMYIHVYMKINL